MKLDYYSKSVGGFINDGIWKELPTDAIPLSDEQYQNLLAMCQLGKMVDVVNGEVVAIDRPPVAPPVPPRVTKFQAKAALHLAGLLDSVESLMADPATDRITRLAWSDSLHFERRSPMISAMSARLGLTETQVDDLFKSAAVIE